MPNTNTNTNLAVWTLAFAPILRQLVITTIYNTLDNFQHLINKPTVLVELKHCPNSIYNTPHQLPHLFMMVKHMFQQRFASHQNAIIKSAIDKLDTFMRQLFFSKYNQDNNQDNNNNNQDQTIFELCSIAQHNFFVAQQEHNLPCDQFNFIDQQLTSTPAFKAFMHHLHELCLNNSNVSDVVCKVSKSTRIDQVVEQLLAIFLKEDFQQITLFLRNLFSKTFSEDNTLGEFAFSTNTNNNTTTNKRKRKRLTTTTQKQHKKSKNIIDEDLAWMFPTVDSDSDNDDDLTFNNENALF